MLTDASLRVFHRYGSYLTVFTFIALLADTNVTINAILTGGTILTEHAVTVIDVNGTVFTCEARWTIAPLKRESVHLQSVDMTTCLNKYNN